MAHQTPVLLDPSRFKILPCGRRWGKTSLGLQAVLRGHGAYKGQYQGAIDGGNVWWVSASFPTAMKIWRDLKKACRDAAIRISEAEMRIELPGGGSVTVKSADSDAALLGEGLDGVVFDETAFIREIVWTEYLRPSLADQQGWAILLGTPNGCNWYHDLFEKATTLKNWTWWQLPTSNNPLITAAELADALLTIGPRAFAQQFEAQFMDIEGAEWPGSYFADVWFDDWPDDLMFKTMALDPSKGKTDKSDYSAYVMLGMNQQGTMYADANLARRDTSQITDDGIGLYRTFQPHSFAVEANQFQEMFLTQFAERSKESGMMVPVSPIFNQVNKQTRLRATLTPYLSRGEIKIRRTAGGKLLVDQLQQFPQGKHDDGPDALEMAVSEMKRLFYAGHGAPENKVLSA